MPLAVVVEERSAERIRKRLHRSGMLDTERKILRRNCLVEMPVVKKLKRYKCVEQAVPEYYCPRINQKTVKRHLASILGEKELGLMKGRWETIGDALILELPKELHAKRREIGSAFLKMFPRTKTVLNRRGIADIFREPKAEVIAGTKTEAVHKENYCRFKLDPTKVMFSAGNIEERRRMAHVSNEREVVLDMFAGIGQFTIPMAKRSRPKKIFAVEKNPIAFRYLKENIELNKLRNVYPILGDCRKVSPKGVADRVIMGYLFDTEKFLPVAVRALKSEGIIHYHCTSMKKELGEKQKNVMRILYRLGCKPKLIKTRIVKSYAPSRWHVVFDIKVGRACKSTKRSSGGVTLLQAELA